MTNRLGFLSALGLFLVGIAYVGVVGIGVAQAGLTEPIVDPVLAIMEVLTLVSAPFIVMLMAAIHAHARDDRKPHATIALAFGTLAAGLTAGVHFVTLTAGRQTGFTTLEWPSTLYALELLAWDVFLGLALLFAAPVLAGPGSRAVARWSLAVAGALCLVGTAGPIVGDMAIHRIGILGYGVVLPVACAALAVVFRRESR